MALASQCLGGSPEPGTGTVPLLYWHECADSSNVARNCSWCEKKITLVRLLRNQQFCSDKHRSLFMDLEIARLSGHPINMARLDVQRLKDARAVLGTAAEQADAAEA